MKYLLVVGFFCMASCLPLDQHIVSVTEDTLGNYKYSFDAGDHSKVEEHIHDGLTKGRFTFVDTDGAHHAIKYSSGADLGFVAESSDIPVAPLPEAENPEVVKAREEHLAAWNAEVAANGLFEEGSSLHSRTSPVHVHTIHHHPTSVHSTHTKTIKVLVPVIEYVRA